MEVSIYLVSWFISPIYGTYNQPTFIGVIIHLLSTMDIPVVFKPASSSHTLGLGF